jgi:ribosomal protein L15
VTFETLYLKGAVTPKYTGGFKVLSRGELNKKVEIHAQGISQAAQDKLSKKGISFSIV